MFPGSVSPLCCIKYLYKCIASCWSDASIVNRFYYLFPLFKIIKPFLWKRCMRVWVTGEYILQSWDENSIFVGPFIEFIFFDKIVRIRIRKVNWSRIHQNRNAANFFVSCFLSTTKQNRYTFTAQCNIYRMGNGHLLYSMCRSHFGSGNRTRYCFADLTDCRKQKVPSNLIYTAINQGKSSSF